MLYLSQLLGMASLKVYSGSLIRCGERFNSWPKSIIYSISLHLFRYGSPAGTVDVNIRAVSDDSVIGTLGSIDITTISTVSYEWYTFNSPVIIPATQNIRLMLEYNGGDISNCVSIAVNNGDVYTGGLLTYYVASYTDNAAYDLKWSLLTWDMQGGRIPLGVRKVGPR